MSDTDTQVTFQAPEIAQLAPLFPGYEIELLIATGGMGAVYRAVQKSLDRTVAIKILPDELSKDAAFCAGFEAEAKAMARLNHPNLIGVYDFGEINGMLFIIMEYVPGKSLFHSANGIAIDQGEVIRLVTGICNGLAHAHEHGIIHRDIKPSNILLDLNAQPKIGDFGLARPMDRQVEEGEEIFGTPHYTAPEVVTPPHTVDYRADIFSVGVMLHELLTGRLPADDRRTASAIIHCDPRFDAIVRRATNPQPEARYSSASEIAHDLHEIATTAGPRVLQTNAPLRQIPGLARPTAHLKKPSGAPGIIILLGVLAIGAVIFHFLSKKPDVPSKGGEPPANIASQPTDAGETKPTPKPAPEPTAPSKSAPQREPEVAAKPEPVPDIEPVTPALPKFDVPGFFTRARTIMLERATPMIAKRDRALADNVSNYDRSLERLLRGGSLRDRASVAELAASFIQEVEKNENRLPEDPDDDLVEIAGVAQIHQDHFKRQQVIDASLLHELIQLSKIYIVGLEKQIDRLKTEDDPLAIALIEKEIAKTRSDPEHFPNLMLGIESSDDDEP